MVGRTRISANVRVGVRIGVKVLRLIAYNAHLELVIVKGSVVLPVAVEYL